MRDLSNNIAPAVSLKSAARTATANGTGVDLRGYDSAAFVLDVGVVTGTTPSATIKAQESDDDATYADVAAADLLGGGQLAAITDGAEDDQLYKRGYIGSKRYVRWALTAITGAGATIPSAGMIIRDQSAQRPA